MAVRGRVNDSLCYPALAQRHKIFLDVTGTFEDPESRAPMPLRAHENDVFAVGRICCARPSTNIFVRSGGMKTGQPEVHRMV
jgi:hypothetical protein